MRESAMPQAGMALPIVLVLLAMAAMLGTAGLRSSLTAERLAGNLKASVQAGMAAEVAASRGWAALNGSGDITVESSQEMSESMTWHEFLDPSHFQGEPARLADCAAPRRCAYRYVEEASRRHFVVAMGAVMEGGGRVLASSEPVRVAVVFSRLAELFSRYVLLAGGEVATGEGRASASRIHGNAAQDEGERVRIPYTDTSPPEGAVSLAVGSDEDGLPYCRFEESGDLGGRVYHCEGRLEIGAAARFHNAAFVARDDAHLSGEIGRASAVDVAVLSGGDIRLEAPGIVRGWLMSAGDAELAPGTALEGAIIAHGDIQASGALAHLVGDPVLPHAPREKRLLSWE
ncbi:pilus assembly PilX family protein [Halomonas caseinilytica]|uniref:pilus assembly PilX family protein n=1 Tax=Halomonas caseinilytica TaxID=438744 RepID=UPI000AF4FE1F|nr:pilus assembly PilX N-terminal domain-containing protein [Halomonas caseinilytica]